MPRKSDPTSRSDALAGLPAAHDNTGGRMTSARFYVQELLSRYLAIFRPAEMKRDGLMAAPDLRTS